MLKPSSLTLTDKFCGAGGSSQGAKDAANGDIGIEIALALNHWELAIKTHNHNFPNTRHDCTDVSAVDPRRYPYTDILMTSPECTNHSLAKGKKQVKNTLDLFKSGVCDPAAERSRATMWDTVRFAEYHRYPVVVVENVVDARKWVLFNDWLNAMHSLNYKHKCVYYNSMFAYPTPQSRDRMYVIFWQKGHKEPNLEFNPKAHCNHCNKQVESVQSWKKHNVQYGKYKQQYVYRCPICTKQVEPFYYAAFNAIDWSRKGQRIGSRKKPLAHSTMERIKYGLDKYADKPLIIASGYIQGINERVRSAEKVMFTQTGDARQSLMIPPQIITTRYSSGVDCRVRDITQPIPTQPGDASHGLLVPQYIVPISQTKSGRKRAKSTTEAIPTQTTREEMILVNPGFFIKNYGKGLDPKYANVAIDETLGTITTADHHGLITTEAWDSFISYQYSGSLQASHISDALGSVMTNNKHLLINHEGTLNIDDCNYRMLHSTEIGRAMAFRDDYVVLGNERERVKQYGNAVTPPVMKMIMERVIETFN